jgi:hypothetical protein
MVAQQFDQRPPILHLDALRRAVHGQANGRARSGNGWSLGF